MAEQFTEVIRHEETVAEERVWQAVIVSTIEEWISGPLRRSQEAEQFLFCDRADFAFVCLSAGMDPDRLRQKLLRLRAQMTVQADRGASRN